MFDRFTRSARAAVVRAFQECQSRGHDYVGTGHLMLALIGGEDGVVVATLSSHGILPSYLRERVEAAVGRGQRASAGPVPFSPRAKTMLEAAAAEADRLGEHHVDVQHLARALAQLDGGAAVRACHEAGVELSWFAAPG